MKPRENNRYSKEERRRVLKEIEAGRITLKEAAREYGMSPSGILYWKIHFGMRKPWGRHEAKRHGQDYRGESHARDKEIEELKIQVANLYLENEFLKKAQAFGERQKRLDSSIITDQNLSHFVKRAR